MEFVRYSGNNEQMVFEFLEGHDKIATSGKNFYIDFNGASTCYNGHLILKQDNQKVNVGDYIVKNKDKFKALTRKSIVEVFLFGDEECNEETKYLYNSICQEIHYQEIKEFLSVYEGDKTPIKFLPIEIPKQNPFLEDKKENSIDYENLSLEEKMEIIKSMFKYVGVHQDREGYKKITITIED